MMTSCLINVKIYFPFLLERTIPGRLSESIINNGASQRKICDVIGHDNLLLAADVMQDTSAAFFDFGLKSNLMNMIKTVYNMGKGFTFLCQNRK
jgi:hypothetical protein